MLLIYNIFLTFLFGFMVNSLPFQDKNSSKNLAKNPSCPKRCFCVHWKSCDWSYKVLPFLTVNVLPLRYSKRNEYIDKFMENICDYKARKVCCCDFSKQVPPDQLQNKETPGKLHEIQTEFKSRISNMHLQFLAICARLLISLKFNLY